MHALETFVDRSRFKGTCYRAVNGLRLGQARGRLFETSPRILVLEVPEENVIAVRTTNPLADVATQAHGTARLFNPQSTIAGSCLYRRVLIPIRTNGILLPAWPYVMGDRWIGGFKELSGGVGRCSRYSF